MTSQERKAHLLAEHYLNWSPSQWNDDGSVNKTNIYVTGYLKACEDEREIKELELAEATSSACEEATCYSIQCDELWAELKEAQAKTAKLVEVLEKIADPRKRDHREPDAYTTLGCLMHMAEQALEEHQK